jgi:N-acetylmuramoyl-L-alanine amidase
MAQVGTASGPIGSGNYVVKQGDCLSSIAFEHGFSWQTLWHHSSNAELQKARKDPSVLLPGDQVFIPALRLGEQSGNTERTHRFRRLGVPPMLRLRLLQPPKPNAPPEAKDEPCVDVPYVLDVEGKLTRGSTDQNGLIEIVIPPNALQATLVLSPGTGNESRIPLQLGHLDPADQVSGVQARLNNLGFACGEDDGVLGPNTIGALKRFQRSAGLEPSGELDQPTLDALARQHDTAA